MTFQTDSFQSNAFQQSSSPDNTNPQPGYAELEPYVPVEIYPFVPFYLIQTRKTGIATFTSAPVFNNPIPNQDQLNNLAAVLAAWNPDPVYNYIHKAEQPYDYGKLPPQITDVPVNSPPPNERQISNLAGILASWNPDPVHSFIHRAEQPYDYLKLVPITQTTFVPYARNWLSTVLSSWQPPDPQPIVQKQLSPGIPGLSVNNPAPNQDQLNNLVGILGAWNPEVVHSYIHKAQQPYDYAKNSPGIPGMSVDNPPFSRKIQPSADNYQWQPSDPLPQRSPNTPQATVVVRTPYTNNWQVTVLQSWQPPDPLPTLPNQLNPQITAVRVDNPPSPFAFSVYESLEYSLPQVSAKLPQQFIASNVLASNPWLSIVIQAWQPSDLPPTLPRNMSPGIPGMSVDTPPLGPADFEYSVPSQTFPWNPFYLRQIGRGTTRSGPTPFISAVNNPIPNQDQLINLMGILSAWNPEPTHYFIHKAQQPYDYAKLPPSITNVPVNNPPFSSRTDLSDILTGWQPNQGTLPQTSQFFPQQAVTSKGPFNNLWLVTVLNAWQPSDLLPTLPKQMSPGIPGMSVDNPPGLWGQTPFEIDDGLIPILRSNLNPAITAVPVNNPPFTQKERLEDIFRIISNLWQPPDPLPTLPVKFNFGIRIDNPPFIVWADFYEDILISWNPEPTHQYIHKAGQPYDYLKMSPGIPGQSVDNPVPNQNKLVNQNIIDIHNPVPVHNYIHRAGQPYDYLKINPGIPGVSVDNPPFTHVSRTIQYSEIVYNSWVPPDPLPTLNILFTTGTRFDNPPFTYPGRTVQFGQIVYNAWIPPDPLPTLNIKLPPALSSVRVDNPPFSSRNQLPNILLFWQPPDPLPTRSVTLKIVISGTALPQKTFEWLQRFRRRRGR